MPQPCRRGGSGSEPAEKTPRVAAAPSFSRTNLPSCSSPPCAAPGLPVGRRRSSRATIATIGSLRCPRSRSLRNGVGSGLCSTSSTTISPPKTWNCSLTGSRSSGFRPARPPSIPQRLLRSCCRRAERGLNSLETTLQSSRVLARTGPKCAGTGTNRLTSHRQARKSLRTRRLPGYSSSTTP